MFTRRTKRARDKKAPAPKWLQPWGWKGKIITSKSVFVSKIIKAAAKRRSAGLLAGSEQRSASSRLVFLEDVDGFGPQQEVNVTSLTPQLYEQLQIYHQVV